MRITAQEAKELAKKQRDSQVEQEVQFLQGQRESIVNGTYGIYELIEKRASVGSHIAIIENLPHLHKAFTVSGGMFDPYKITPVKGEEHIVDFYNDISDELRSEGFAVEYDGHMNNFHLKITWGDEKSSWFAKLLRIFGK